MTPTHIDISTGQVLLATADPVLRESRTAILNHFGLRTIASESTAHAIELIETIDFDVLVLGNTLSPNACRDISGAFRRFRPQGRIIEILPASGIDCRDHPDVTVRGLAGPDALRSTVAEQLRIARTLRD